MQNGGLQRFNDFLKPSPSMGEGWVGVEQRTKSPHPLATLCDLGDG